MLTTALGAAWLLLAPAALWFLIRGRNAARVGAVLTLALLEAATLATAPLATAGNEPTSAAETAASPARPAVAPPAVRPAAACRERIPVPASAKLVGARDLELSWAASPGECDSAGIVLHPKGRRLRIWIHEGPLRGHHKEMRTLPVRIVDGPAVLRVPLPSEGSYRPVDGRSGKRIPLLQG